MRAPLVIEDGDQSEERSTKESDTDADENEN